MIVLKLGGNNVFQEPLFEMKNYKNNTNQFKENMPRLSNAFSINSNNITLQTIKYDIESLDYIDFFPKRFIDFSSDSFNQEMIYKLENKKNTLNKVINSNFFDKNIDVSFENDINKLSNEMKNLNIAVEYSDKYDYKSFKNLIDILCLFDYDGITNNIQYFSEIDYMNLNKEQYKEILRCITQYKYEILINLGCDETSDNSIINLDNNLDIKINKNSILQKYNKIFNFDDIIVPDFYYCTFINGKRYMTSNNITINKKKDIKNIKDNDNIYKKLLKKNLSNKFYDANKFELFRLMTSNPKLSNREISEYLNKSCINVTQAVEKYYQHLYNTKNLTLTFFYPETKESNKKRIVHNFNFTSPISLLFDVAIVDFTHAMNVKLFTYNQTEINEKEKRIKCIGGLNLENNSVIVVIRDD